MATGDPVDERNEPKDGDEGRPQACHYNTIAVRHRIPGVIITGLTP